MPSQPHLQTFNLLPPIYDEGMSFVLFPLLPRELRLRIWWHALQRRRLVKVCLERVAEGGEPSVKHYSYHVIVDGSQILSKFLRVNNESRGECLNFNRIHIPCTFTRKVKGEKEMWTSHETLHFSPETDFLYVEPVWPPEISMDFLHHLKCKLDPCHVGLLNLALDHNGVNRWAWQNPSDIDPEIRQSFVETLTHMSEVFFVSRPLAGRTIVGPLSGLPTAETLFNRSFPIMAMAPTFVRHRCDPRPIAKDLEKVLTGTADPRAMPFAWMKVLDRWGVSSPYIQYRFLLAFDPTLSSISIVDRESASEFLQREDDNWNGIGADDRFLKPCVELKWRIGAHHKDWRNENLAKAVKPAFGFWLFPLEALGPLHEEGLSKDEGYRPMAKRILDMTKYWPELALTSLP